MIESEAAVMAEEEDRRYGEAKFVRAQNHEPTEGRRAHQRFRVDLEVNIGSDHNFYAGFLENMSVGGVFIATHLIKPAGTIIDFSLKLPGHAEPVTGRGEVRWVREYNERNDVPPGMGVRFLELAAGCLEAIQRFLATRDPIFWED